MEKKKWNLEGKQTKIWTVEFRSYGHVMVWVEPSDRSELEPAFQKQQTNNNLSPASQPLCASPSTSAQKPRNCDIRMRRGKKNKNKKNKTLQETSMSCKTLRHLKFCMVNITVCQLRGPSYTMTDWHGEARASFDPNPLSCSRAKSFSGRDKKKSVEIV